jgi:hypothetical protein
LAGQPLNESPGRWGEHGGFDEVSATSGADVERVPEEASIALVIIDGFSGPHWLRGLEQGTD